MLTKLSLQEKLKDERTNRHMTLAQLAEATGISSSTLSKYESENCTDISPFNLAKLAEYYGLSMDYLLGLTENKNHPNAALSELHLSDDMVDLLKSGRINNRLLCEMACHPAFRRLMADIEVCVDRIVDSRIRDMNLCLDEARRKIVEKYHPGEDDTMLRTLDMAKIDDEILFANTIHRDLDTIVRDIRKAHASDPTTAEQETFVGFSVKMHSNSWLKLWTMKAARMRNAHFFSVKHWISALTGSPKKKRATSERFWRDRLTSQRRSASAERPCRLNHGSGKNAKILHLSTKGPDFNSDPSVFHHMVMRKSSQSE